MSRCVFCVGFDMFANLWLEMKEFNTYWSWEIKNKWLSILIFDRNMLKQSYKFIGTVRVEGKEINVVPM